MRDKIAQTLKKQAPSKRLPKVTRSQLTTFRIVTGNEKSIDKVILCGVVKCWVGFG